METTNKDLVGQKFGRLTVREKGPIKIQKNGQKLLTWICDCECGNETIATQRALLIGNKQSCGCLLLEFLRNKRKNNKYDLSGDFGIGYTEKNEKFYFDLEDYDRINKIHWGKNQSGYFYGKDTVTHKLVLLHRYIMQAPSNLVVDHIGGSETLFDNRKANLRLVARSQNSKNHKLYGHNKSGVTGVYWVTQAQKWEAVVTVEGRKVRLGQYKNKEDAIKARKEGERRYYKEYSYDQSQILYKGGN